MDYRSKILAAIDRLQRNYMPVDATAVYAEIDPATLSERERVASELRAMAKAGIVVYDRKASGWRRAS